MKKKQFILSVVTGALALGSLLLSTHVKADMPLYRMYNPHSKTYLYTKNAPEYEGLTQKGWVREGVAWNSSDSEGEAVYRLYHSKRNAHMYTKNSQEYRLLSQKGWRAEGTAFRSSGTVPVFRLYHASSQRYFYTRHISEYKKLQQHGWKAEGVAFYGLENTPKEYMVAMTNRDTDGQVVAGGGGISLTKGQTLGYSTVPGYHIHSVRLWAVTGGGEAGFTKLADVTHLIDSTKSTLSFDQLTAIYPKTKHSQYLFEVIWEKDHVKPTEYALDMLHTTDDGVKVTTKQSPAGIGGGYIALQPGQRAGFGKPDGYKVKSFTLHTAKSENNRFVEVEDVTKLVNLDEEGYLTFEELDKIFSQTNTNQYTLRVVWTKE